MSNMTIEALAAQYREAKADMNRAKARFAVAEKLIMDHPDVASLARTEGTVHIGPVSVTYGLARKWDQEQLAELQEKVSPAFFPFKTEFKEDLRATRTFQKAFPELIAALEAALTQTPKKPSIKVADPAPEPE